MTSPAVKKLMDAARSARRYLGQLRGSPETRAVVMEYYHELDNAILAVEAEEAYPRGPAPIDMLLPAAKMISEALSRHVYPSIEFNILHARLQDAIRYCSPRVEAEEAAPWKSPDIPKPTDMPPPTDTVTFTIPAEVAEAMATEPAPSDREALLDILAILKFDHDEYAIGYATDILAALRKLGWRSPSDEISDAMVEAAMHHADAGYAVPAKLSVLTKLWMRDALAAAMKAGRA